MTNSIAFAVIGANWGDEGKGLATDAMAHRLAAEGGQVTVVRSNGGAQAGHGVERPGHVRHVFHHVGAGTLAGAATHLSRFFVAHPMLLGRELADLEALGAAPRRVTIDPRAPVTTPWDMAINQILELARGGGRHGSCGIGFGETIERQERGFALTAADLHDPDLADRLARIRDVWAPARLDELGIADRGGFAGIFLPEFGILERFLEDVAAFRSHVSLLADARIARDGIVLFEGAQGLRLDMDFGEMPHVTRSHTGLRNMLSIAAEAGIGEIRPLYMTRAYATRHGAGPLPHEVIGEGGTLPLPWAEVVDETNAPNDWQGHIRQAVLDLDALSEIVRRDIRLAEGSGIGILPSVGVTCLDQLRPDSEGAPGRGEVVADGIRVTSGVGALPDLVADRLGLPLALSSWGPTRETVAWSGFARDMLLAPIVSGPTPAP